MRRRRSTGLGMGVALGLNEPVSTASLVADEGASVTVTPSNHRSIPCCASNPPPPPTTHHRQCRTMDPRVVAAAAAEEDGAAVVAAVAAAAEQEEEAGAVAAAVGAAGEWLGRSECWDLIDDCGTHNTPD